MYPSEHVSIRGCIHRECIHQRMYSPEDVSTEDYPQRMYPPKNISIIHQRMYPSEDLSPRGFIHQRKYPLEDASIRGCVYQKKYSVEDYSVENLSSRGLLTYRSPECRWHPGCCTTRHKVPPLCVGAKVLKYLEVFPEHPGTSLRHARRNYSSRVDHRTFLINNIQYKPCQGINKLWWIREHTELW